MKKLRYVGAARNYRAQFILGSVPRFRLGLVIVVVSFLMSALAVLERGQQPPVSASTSAACAQSVEDHIVNIPYFAESEGMASTITLNNNLIEASEVKLTIFNHKGEPFTPPPITLRPNSVERVSLKSLTEAAKGDFTSGSIQVSYRGVSMAVTSQVSITSDRLRLSFESPETSMMDYSSAHLDGIVWAPDRDTRPFVALTNTTAGKLTATITATQRQDRQLEPVILDPHETRVIDLKEFLAFGKGVSAALVSLEHDGAPGALVTAGFAINEKTGFSCNLPFADRSTAKSSQLSGAHVRFGAADPKGGFPAGTTFLAPLVIANASKAPSKAHIYVDYTAGSEGKRADLGMMNLAPQEVRQVELSKELARRGVKGPVEEAGVDIEYSGQPGAVIARLTSADKSGDYSFDVPIKDPMAGSMRGSGGYPWRLDGGHNTVVHLKNTVDKPVHAIVQVRYDGSSYNLERIKMGAHQSVAVDIGQLRDAQQQDIREAVMPTDVESGQVVWFEEEIGSLIGRVEVADIGAGVSASFSCPQGCQCPPSYNSSFMTPSSSAGLVGGTAQFTEKEMRRDCQGLDYGPYNRTQDSTWTSSNTSVMTVSAGRVSCLSAGSADILARFQAVIYTLNCFNNVINPGNGGNVAVFRLKVTVPDSAIHFEDSADSASVVAGEGFGMIVNAVDNSGARMSVNATVGVSASRGLGSTERGLPASISLVNGEYVNGGLVLNRVSGTERGTTFRFSNGGAVTDFSLYTYFRVNATREGQLPNPTQCNYIIQPNDHLVALPVRDLCNLQVVVRNPTSGQSDTAPKKDAGPHFPGGTCDPGGSVQDPYWNTGTRPKVEGLTCERGDNNAGIDLGDGTFSAVGSPSQVVWRWQ
jgi:hypothetical protein